MELIDLFKSDTSFFKRDLKSKDEVIDFITEQLLEKKVIDSKDKFKKAILKREALDSTGIGDGIALPHAINSTVKTPTIAFLSLEKPIEWKSLDNKPVDLIFFIATSGEDDSQHLTALSSLSGYLVKQEYQEKFRAAKNFKTIETLLSKKEKKVDKKEVTNGKYDVVGITACPTGIAHTYLAQEKLEEYAKQLNMTVKVETQGRRGTENKLTTDEINNAKVIILAHDKALTGLDRFNGLEVIDTSTKDVIYHGSELIKEYETRNKVVIKASASKDGDEGGEFSLKKFKDFKGNLLAGISRMLPFVVAGGIVLGIGFLIDIGTSGTDGLFGTHRAAAGWFSAVGKTAMSLMIPILAAYIAYSIVGPQGLMPGLVGGLFSSSIMSFAYGDDAGWSNMWGKIITSIDPSSKWLSHVDSGFIGAIFAGYMAAFSVYFLTIWMSRLPKGLQGVRDIVIIPVISLLATSVIMFVANIPLGIAMSGVSLGIQKLAESHMLPLVAAIIGLMMCVDMGGPVNKIAYVLGTMSVGNSLITTQGSDAYNDQTIIMAASMFAGMLPPLMIAISTVIFPKAWTEKDRDAAKVNWMMGAFFITEGAIPFMIKDLKRISVSSMTGGLLIGFFVGLFGIKIGAPHGGVLTFALIDLGKSGLINFGIKSQAANIGIGIGLSLTILIGCSAASGTILGLWRLADIKKGKLVLA